MSDGDRPSYLFNALLMVGMLLTVLGAASAIFGWGGKTSFEGSYKDIKLKTSDVGLAIMVIGAVLTVTLATHVPKGVRLFTEEAPRPMETLAGKLIIPSVAVAALGVILLVVSHLR